MPQDMPPTGGYQPVQYKVRSLSSSQHFSSEVHSQITNVDLTSIFSVTYLFAALDPLPTSLACILLWPMDFTDTIMECVN